VTRSTFVNGTLALIAAPAAPHDAFRQRIARVADASSGTLGIWARSLGGAAPLGFNADEIFPTASVIKVLILVALYARVDRHPALLHHRVALRAADLVGGSDVLAHAGAGDRFSVATLARAMIVQSDNTAANSLITLLGFSTIAAAARAAGLRRTHLRRHFLDYTAIVHHSENLSTPRDMGRLLYAIERGAREGLHTVASPTSCRHMIDILLHQEDREKLAAGLPRGVPLANKTGEISGVRNDVGIVDPYGDGPYIIAVLTKDLGNYYDGTNAIRTVARVVDARLGKGR
jgi:beta-lactamase class A